MAKQPAEKTHYGDEDPEFQADSDPELEEELFETAKHMGWTPDDLQDKAFARRYKEWLGRQAK